MDLQAILDESSSSTSSVGNNIRGSISTTSSAGELERILREEEDLSDDDVDRVATDQSMLSGDIEDRYNYNSTRLKDLMPREDNSYLDNDYIQGSQTQEDNYNNNDSREHELYGNRFGAGNARTNPNDSDEFDIPSHATNPTAHSAEDWAILQQILGEDEDGGKEQEVDDWAPDKHATAEQNMNHSMQTSPILPNKIDVDTILGSLNSDDEEDLDRLLEPSADHRSFTDALLTADTMEEALSVQNDEYISHIQSSAGPFSSGIAAESQRVVNGSFQSQVNNLSKGQEPDISEEDHNKFSEAAMKFAQDCEKRLLKPGQRDIVSPLHVKRRMQPSLEVGTREQQKAKKDGNSTKVHLSNVQSRFEFSGLCESKSMPKITARLSGSPIDPGLPTALAVNSKFISIGFQKGAIYVFDLFEELRQTLGPTSDQVPTNDNALQRGIAVTSIDMTENGDALVAGYTTGSIILWDVIKGVILRSVTDIHPSPITSVRFLSGPDLKLVSVDAGGLVHKLVFSKNILWSNYSVDYDCLLDGTAGQILAMSVLPPISSIDPRRAMVPKHATHPFLLNLDLIALSSDRSSFAIAVEPSVNVLHRWAKPNPEQIRPDDDLDEESSQDLPCVSWGWALMPGGGHVATAILARAWGCCIQFLHANFPDEVETNNEGEQFLWPAFGVHDEFNVAAPVLALEWLGERSLVYLTLTNEFTVVDTVMMTLLERLDFSGFNLVYAEFSLSRSASKAETQRTTSNLCTTFQNSVRSSEDRILVLCQKEVKAVSILGAKSRISALEHDGEWLGALAFALDHYESTIKSQEDRKRDPEGKRDLSEHPEFSSVERSEDEEWIARLLLRYLNLAVENAPESDRSTTGIGVHTPGKVDLAQSHFQMLAGVCIEFCVVTRRLDLLFGQIFRCFHSVGYLSVFLDVLEPYVLNDKLAYIAPEAMAHFVDHCKANNGVATVERCLLHMDVTIMDFDSIIALLKKNEMYSALVHVYTHGLDDFISPAKVLFSRMFDAADEGNIVDKCVKNPFERFGYKILLYLQSCFRGKTFPQEIDLKPFDRVRTLRPQLVRFLLQENYTVENSASSEVFGYRAFRYPYAYILLALDARAFLDTLSLVLDAPDVEFVESKGAYDTTDDWGMQTRTQAESKDDDAGDVELEGRCPSRQSIVSILASFVIPKDVAKALDEFGTPSQSKLAVGAFLDFMAKYLMQGVIRANKSEIFLILSRMTDRFVNAKDSVDRQIAQSQIIDLLSALSSSSYDTDKVLDLLQGAGISRAALILHQQCLSSWNEGGEKQVGSAEHFRNAIDCYLNDHDTEFQKNVFNYVKKECTVSTPTESSGSLGETLSAKLPELINLDPILSAQLVAELFIEELDEVIVSLFSKDGGTTQYKFLHTIISGDLARTDPVAGPVLSANLTVDHHQTYLALLARLHPDMVYEYLSTHDTYRPDECLKLCQEYDIADASAYLLERMGNVTSALQLILQTLESRLMGLKRSIRGTSTSGYDISSRLRFSSSLNKKRISSSEISSKHIKDVKDVKRILVVALDLCERNSGNSSTRTEHGSQLWFNVLDRLINAKGFLRLAKEQPQHAEIMASILSELLQLTMQRMVSSVPLTDLVHKVTAEHSGSRLGEFREMIGTLLSTYGFEHDVCTGAVNVLHHDTRTMERDRRTLKVEGSRIGKIMNRPLKRSLPLGGRGFVESLSHNGVSLKSGPDGDASLSDGGLVLDNRSNNAGLSNVLSLLRSRRDSGKGGKTQVRTKSGLCMMTSSDLLFHAGESSEAMSLGERQIGMLGAAEHYGSFRTFQ